MPKSTRELVKSCMMGGLGVDRDAVWLPRGIHFGVPEGGAAIETGPKNILTFTFQYRKKTSELTSLVRKTSCGSFVLRVRTLIFLSVRFDEYFAKKEKPAKTNSLLRNCFII